MGEGGFMGVRWGIKDFRTRSKLNSHACEFLFHGKAAPIGPSYQSKKSQGPDQFHPIIKLKRSS